MSAGVAGLIVGRDMSSASPGGNALERAARVLQERSLLECRQAAKHRVAVWKAAEAVDDLLVSLCVAQQIRIIETADENHRADLIGSALTMFEGQVEEKPTALVEPVVQPARERFCRHVPRQFIRCECAG